ncbi:MAG: hypothetical protein K5986_12450 [Clostridium sp.]|nr:hypothetical protein [Clostridium sp.]
MKKSKGIIRGLLLIVIIGICAALYFKVFNTGKGTIVTTWDNMYNENNLEFFYETQDSIASDKRIQNLKDTYSVEQLVSGETSEINKVLKTVEILNSAVEYDDVKDTLKYNGYDILKEKGTGKKTSGRDMAIIERDLLLSAGFISRTGEFRKEDPEFKSKPSYFVVEYWSEQYNKWVMVDFIDKGYLESNGVPLSAIEVINSDIKDLTYVGKSSQNDYRKKIKKYLNSYTIPIDSTLSTTKSNSYVTYVKDSKYVQIMVNGNYILPTIFTQNTNLFGFKPGAEITGKDSRPYLILMKKPVSGKEEKLTFVVGAFENGSIINDCYIKINDEGFEKVSKYKEFDLRKGENTIQLSTDEQNVISTIVLKSHK